MMRSVQVRAVLLCGMLSGVAAACAAQAYTPPPPPLTTLPPCPADKDAKKRAKRKDCDPTVYPSEKLETKGKKGGDAAPAVAPPAGGAAADKFPFPGEHPAASDSAVKKFPFPGDSGAGAGGDSGGSVHGDGSPAAPPDPAAEKRAEETSAGKRFPFPGEAPQAADGASPVPAPKPDEPTPDASSSSSSSAESSSSSDDAAGGDSSKRAHAKNPDDDDDDDPPKLKDKGSSGRRTLKVVKPQSDDDRVDEDLSVAKFYGQSGNYMGAYLRAKDAVKTEPEYPEGHFALGEAAMRLKKKDEAAAEFQTYLKLAPDGERAKAAEKALEELK